MCFFSCLVDLLPARSPISCGFKPPKRNCFSIKICGSFGFYVHILHLLPLGRVPTHRHGHTIHCFLLISVVHFCLPIFSAKFQIKTPGESPQTKNIKHPPTKYHLTSKCRAGMKKLKLATPNKKQLTFSFKTVGLHSMMLTCFVGIVKIMVCIYSLIGWYNPLCTANIMRT